MTKYRVKRHLGSDESIMVKSTTFADCEHFLNKMRGTWADVADMGSFDGHPYVVELRGKSLTVKQGGRMVDHYIIEKV